MVTFKSNNKLCLKVIKFLRNLWKFVDVNALKLFTDEGKLCQVDKITSISTDLFILSKFKVILCYLNEECHWIKYSTRVSKLCQLWVKLSYVILNYDRVEKKS